MDGSRKIAYRFKVRVMIDIEMERDQDLWPDHLRIIAKSMGTDDIISFP